MVRGAYERLRELIIDGSYRPGHRLTQGELSEVLGIGRTPLREALRMLEADGYLSAVANRGVTVSQIDLRAAEELYAMRLLVEPPLIGSLAGTFSEDELAAMEVCLTELDQHSDRSPEFQQHHLHFHQIAVQHYGTAIESFVLQLYERIVWAQRAYMSRPRTAQDFITADTKLLTALRTGDSRGAKQLMQFHLIDGALGVILDVEPEHEFDALPKATRGIGIELAMQGNHITPPSEIRWRSGVCPELHGLETANLKVATD